LKFVGIRVLGPLGDAGAVYDIFDYVSHFALQDALNLCNVINLNIEATCNNRRDFTKNIEMFIGLFCSPAMPCQ
jgi:hypothetical protein